MTMNPTELKEYVKKHGAKMIDAKIVDFLGQRKHLTYPIERLEEGLEDGSRASTAAPSRAGRRSTRPTC